MHTIRNVRHIPPELKGHLVGVQLQVYGNTDWLTVWGVYLPQDPCIRKQAYDFLAEANKASGKHSIFAGDWNASLFSNDRADDTETPQDRGHRTFVTSEGLEAIDALSISVTPEKSRARTYVSHADRTICSRIDDILILHRPDRDPETRARTPATATLQVILSSAESDHDPILAHIPWHNLALTTPQTVVEYATAPRVSRLKTPVPNHALEAFKEAMSIEVANETQAFLEHTTEILQEIDQIRALHPKSTEPTHTLLATHGYDNILVEELMEELTTTLLSKTMPIARQTCEFTQPSTEKHNRRFHLTRQQAKEVTQAMNVAKCLRHALDEYNKQPPKSLKTFRNYKGKSKRAPR